MCKTRKKTTAIIVMVVLFLNLGLIIGTVKVKAATAYGANLVVNGFGDLSGTVPDALGSTNYAGWNSTSIESGESTAFVVGHDDQFGTGASPNGGNFFDFYPISEASDTLYQTIDISDISTDVDNGNVICYLQGYLKKLRAASSATIVLEMLDSSDNVLSTYQLTEDSADNSDDWVYKKLDRIPVNTNTRTLKISLNASISNAGPDSDYIQFDGINLYLNPVSVINVKGNNINIANNDFTPDIMDHTNFGSADITSGSVTKTFVIESNGAKALLLYGASKVAIYGTNASDFAVTTQPSSPVSVGDTTSFDITFNPSAVGVRSAIIIIENSSFQDPYTFYIAGTGTELSPVSDFAISGKTTTSATFTWTGVNGATAISIEKSAVGENNWSTATTGAIAVDATSATVTGLSAESGYDFRLVVTGGANAGYSNEVTVTTDTQDITEASVLITAPVLGADPQNAEEVQAATNHADFTVTGLTWNEALTTGGKFKAERVYTATVTLTSKNGKKFQSAAFTPTVAGSDSVGITTTSGGAVGNTVSFTVTYAATGELTVSSIAVTTQPTKMSYTETTDGVLELNGLQITESNNDGSTKIVTFTDGTAADYTSTPANATVLTNATHNGHPVTITHTVSGKTANTNNLTVVEYPTNYSVFVDSNKSVVQGSGLTTLPSADAGGVSGTLTWYSDSGCSTPAVDSDIGTLNVGGSVTLYWSFIASSTDYVQSAKTGSCVVTIVSGSAQTLSFANSSLTKTLGDLAFTNALTHSLGTGTVTYSSSNESVATVNSTNGEVTIVGVGTATITASAAMVPGIYAPGSASFTLTINAPAQLAQVTDVILSSSGVATWNDVSNEAGYEVQLYKGGVAQGIAVNKPADTLSHDFLSDMRQIGVGVYTVKVTAKGNGSTYTDGSQSTASGSQTIAKLATVQGLIWDGDVAHWTMVSNALSYDVQLYKNGTALNAPVNVISAVSAVDFKSAIEAAGKGTYTYKVTAKSILTSLFLDADLSAVSNENIKAPSLAIGTTNPPAGTIGTAYIGFDFSSTGGVGSKSYTVTSGSLPIGLSLAADGTLTGNPTSPGTFSFTVSVTDSNTPPAIDNHIFTIIISAANYTVSFDSQGGSPVSSIANINSGARITAPAAPKRTSYIFKGWYKESGCTNAWDFETDTVIGNVTLYAKWTVNSSNGGNGGYTNPTTPSLTPTPTSAPTPKVSLKIAKDNIQVEIEFTSDVIKYYDGQITLPIASDEILNELEKVELSGVRVGLHLPVQSDDAGQEEINLILESEVIQKAKDNNKNIVVDVKDSNNNVLYSWTFDKSELANSDKEIKDVNLSLKVDKARDSAHLFDEQKDDKDHVALVVDFAHEGELPSQASVRIYVGNQEGITPGTKVYLYHYNEKNGKLETIPYGYQATVDEDGYITVNILQCSDYVVYTKKADPKRFVSLKNQIKVSPTKISLSLAEGENSSQIAVKLPVTLERISSFDEPTSQSAIGGVTIRFTSSDNQIATVDSKGNITAKAPGEVVIKTTITLYSKKTKKVETRVKVK